MTAALHSAELPDRVYRLGREPDPWEWPDWSYAVGGTFGNRFDDPDGQYRVLYASTERETTFRECLARFRPDPAIVAAEIAENDDDEDSPQTLPAGQVALTWLENRRLGTGRLIGEFCDIGHSASIVHLRQALASRLRDYGLDDLDAGDIRLRAPRGFTREISRYIFEQADQGQSAYAGIRYGSRLGDELTNWAIFEPNEPVDCEQEEIEPEDPDLVRVLEEYGLTVCNGEATRTTSLTMDTTVGSGAGPTVVTVGPAVEGAEVDGKRHDAYLQVIVTHAEPVEDAMARMTLTARRVTRSWREDDLPVVREALAAVEASSRSFLADLSRADCPDYLKGADAQIHDALKLFIDAGQRGAAAVEETDRRQLASAADEMEVAVGDVEVAARRITDWRSGAARP